MSSLCLVGCFGPKGTSGSGDSGATDGTESADEGESGAEGGSGSSGSGEGSEGSSGGPADCESTPDITGKLVIGGRDLTFTDFSADLARGESDCLNGYTLEFSRGTCRLVVQGADAETPEGRVPVEWARFFATEDCPGFDPSEEDTYFAGTSDLSLGWVTPETTSVGGDACHQNRFVVRLEGSASGTQGALGIGSTTLAAEGAFEAVTNADACLAECIVDGHCGNDQACLSGVCAAYTCTPGDEECVGNDVYRCDSDGQGRTEVRVCGSNATCQDASCEPHVCTPSEDFCSGDDVRRCEADGLGSRLVQQCTAQQACVSGACEDLACIPGDEVCRNGDVYRCDSDGMGETLWDSCSFGEYCENLSATCEPWVCTPDADSCDGDTARTCNSEGSGYTGIGTDCAAMGQFCDAGACSSAGTVQVGTLDSLNSVRYDFGIAGTFLSVDSTVTLESVEMYVDPQNSPSVTWVVYEGLSATDTYTRIASSSTTLSIDAQYWSSPTFDVPLVSGRYYLLGLVVDGDGTNYISDVFYDDVGVPESLPFGEAFAFAEGFSEVTAPSTLAVGSLNRDTSRTTIMRLNIR